MIGDRGETDVEVDLMLAARRAMSSRARDPPAVRQRCRLRGAARRRRVEPCDRQPVSAFAEVRAVREMIEQPDSRVGEYRKQAAVLRLLAYQTRYPESRHRLLTLADSFDKLADRVEAREIALANAAD